MSGAVGSSPSLIRSGTPVASDRASLTSQSASGMSSLQRRLETRIASSTASVTGCFPSGDAETEDTNIGRLRRLRTRLGRYTEGGFLQHRLETSYEAGREPTILVAPRRRRSTEARSRQVSAER